MFRRSNQTSFIIQRIELYKNDDLIISYNHHRFYRDIVFITKIQRLIDNHKQIFQTSEFFDR